MVNFASPSSAKSSYFTEFTVKEFFFKDCYCFESPHIREINQQFCIHSSPSRFVGALVEDMVGIATFSLCHVNNQIPLLITASVFLQFLNDNAVSLEVFNHIIGLLGVIALIKSHWNHIIIGEEFLLSMFDTTDHFTIWSN